MKTSGLRRGIIGLVTCLGLTGSLSPAVLAQPHMPDAGSSESVATAPNVAGSSDISATMPSIPGSSEPRLPKAPIDVYHQLVGAVMNAPGVPQFLEHTFHQFQQNPHLNTLRAPSFFASDAWYNPLPPVDFAQPRVVKIEKDEGLRVERWFIESPAMRRTMEVQVMRAYNSAAPAPMIYLFDGATAPSRNGWLRRGEIEKLFATEQVTAIMPTQASGSSYVDWTYEDSKIQKPMWETFLTKELPPLLEDPARGLHFNGKRFIGGLSMGAGGAIRLANANPDMFHGAIGLSGCYSNSTPMGRFMVEAIANSVSADHTKLFGPGPNPMRERYDVVKNPAGLSNMPVYLFSADGYVTQRDIDAYRTESLESLPGAVLLEIATFKCTHELDDALKARNHQQYKVVYQHGGVHDWTYYAEQMPFAWKYISEAGDAWNQRR